MNTSTPTLDPATDPTTEALPALDRYEKALDATVGWLERSVAASGGSRAYRWLWPAWARPYPETTGYIIPTLLAYADRERAGSESPLTRRGQDVRAVARRLGRWLLDVQQPEGYWFGGQHPPRQAAPSVFNTGQVLLGLCALYDATGEENWLAAADAAARWLAAGVDADGNWAEGNYRGAFNPAYYTRVAWPMLEVWARTGEGDVRAAAERVLARVRRCRTPGGAFEDWGFSPGAPAPTHTIAYTLRGFLESARLLDDWPAYGEPVEPALHRLYRLAGLSRGRLPGAFRADWSRAAGSVCLTGNAQVALCLLRLYEREGDLRLVDAACKLVDVVTATQLRSPMAGPLRGAVAGSWPVWGRYMALRYPNWAAKFHADSLLLLLRHLAPLVP